MITEIKCVYRYDNNKIVETEIKFFKWNFSAALFRKNFTYVSSVFVPGDFKLYYRNLGVFCFDSLEQEDSYYRCFDFTGISKMTKFIEASIASEINEYDIFHIEDIPAKNKKIFHMATLLKIFNSAKYIENIQLFQESVDKLMIQVVSQNDWNKYKDQNQLKTYNYYCSSDKSILMNDLKVYDNDEYQIVKQYLLSAILAIYERLAKLFPTNFPARIVGKELSEKYNLPGGQLGEVIIQFRYEFDGDFARWHSTCTSMVEEEARSEFPLN